MAPKARGKAKAAPRVIEILDAPLLRDASEITEADARAMAPALREAGVADGALCGGFHDNVRLLRPDVVHYIVYSSDQLWLALVTCTPTDRPTRCGIAQMSLGGTAIFPSSAVVCKRRFGLSGQCQK